jgi:hypothetical protein
MLWMRSEDRDLKRGYIEIAGDCYELKPMDADQRSEHRDDQQPDHGAELSHHDDRDSVGALKCRALDHGVISLPKALAATGYSASVIITAFGKEG